MADEIIIPIIAEVGNKKSYKSIQEYTNYLESQLESAFDTSLLNPLDKAGKKWNALIKQGRKYREVIVTTTKKGKLKTFNITDKQYSLAEARKLMSASSLYGAKTLRTDIQVERRNQPKKAKKLTQEEVVKAEQEEINKLQTESNSKLAKIRSLSSIIGGELKGSALTKFQLSSAKKELSELEKQFKLVKEGDASYVALSEKIKSTQKRINELTDSLRQQNQEALDDKKLSGFEKFMNRFKSYGLVRILRNFFSFVEKGFSESLTSLARFDSGVNDSMSSITSSFTIMSNSLVTVIAPLLQLVEPIIRTVANGVAKLAEGISYLIAKLTGSATYLKANTKYLKNFSDEMNRFSFDKFESLSGSDDSANMFEKANVSDGLFGDALSSVERLGAILAGISGYLIVKKLVDGSIQKGLENIGKVFTQGGWIKLAGIAGIILGISSAFEGFIELLRTDGKSVIGWIKTILGLLAAVAGIIAMIKGKTIGGMIAGGIAIASTVGIIIANSVAASKSVEVQQYANGGIAEQGDLFIANEKGPELVYSGPNNSSSIMNISQFKQATLEALYAWWDEAKYDLPEGNSFNIDGAQIARSKSFIAEMNRRNTGLGLK